MSSTDSPAPPTVHIIQILIRQMVDGKVALLLHPHHSWKPDGGGSPYLVFPTRKTVADIAAPVLEGTPIERFIAQEMAEDVGLGDDDYVVEQEIDPVEILMESMVARERKRFVITPVDVWVSPARRDILRQQVGGVWLTPENAIAHPDISPSAKAVCQHLIERDARLTASYDKAARGYAEMAKRSAEFGFPNPLRKITEAQDETPDRLLLGVPDRPSAYALAMRWFNRNRSGVRHLTRRVIDDVLETGDRAFNLRVADPYLRYQLQGVGFTWSFFTHKDKQDIHVHGAPIVEIYGILEGRMEIWWKPYYNQGTSAWSHRILEPGDWAEVEPLQCHVVHWLTEGKGVVFKAGPAPLAEVGRLGVKGKTPCEGCICVKPKQVCALVTG